MSWLLTEIKLISVFSVLCTVAVRSFYVENGRKSRITLIQMTELCTDVIFLVQYFPQQINLPLFVGGQLERIVGKDCNYWLKTVSAWRRADVDCMADATIVARDAGFTKVETQLQPLPKNRKLSFCLHLPIRPINSQVNHNYNVSITLHHWSAPMREIEVFAVRR